jgi:hypothetical protein
MENIIVRCKQCNKELESHPAKTKCCGCPNMTTVKDNVITAVDLSKVIILNNIKTKKNTSILSPEDISWQESRKKRNIKKLDFEVK